MNWICWSPGLHCDRMSASGTVCVCVCLSALVEKWQPFMKVSSSHQELPPVIAQFSHPQWTTHCSIHSSSTSACRCFCYLPRNSWKRQLFLPRMKSEQNFTCNDLKYTHSGSVDATMSVSAIYLVTLDEEFNLITKWQNEIKSKKSVKIYRQVSQFNTRLTQRDDF